MDRTIKLVLGVGVIFAIVCVVFFLTSVPKSEDNGVIYFFYGEECPHCHKIMPFVMNMTQKYPDVDIRILEVSNNQTNQNIYTEVNDRIGETPPGVPEVVTGKIVLIGEKDIPDKLEGVILEQLKKNR